jgi:predicted nucleotidyltransferase
MVMLRQNPVHWILLPLHQKHRLLLARLQVRLRNNQQILFFSRKEAGHLVSLLFLSLPQPNFIRLFPFFASLIAVGSHLGLSINGRKISKSEYLSLIRIGYLCVMNQVDEHIEEVTALCVKHHVEELYLFGSILSDKFNESSDIDLLIRFADIQIADYFDNYMDLKDALEGILLRPVDLVEVQTIKNPYLKKSIDRTKRLIYARANLEMAL